jgi:AcrR family transcriptional regulator
MSTVKMTKSQFLVQLSASVQIAVFCLPGAKKALYWGRKKEGWEMSNFLKEAKRQNLLDSAYELFLEKGTLGTTISDIVQRADVAKGTFYLYFKDKDDIFHALVDRISYRVLADAVRSVHESTETDFTEKVILFADCIIEYFRRSPMVLRLMDRHFSWPRLEREIAQSSDPLLRSLMQQLMASPVMQGRTEADLRNLVFSLTEMVGAVCYSSIIDGRPAPISEMKPVLYGIIRGALRPVPPAEGLTSVS